MCYCGLLLVVYYIVGLRLGGFVIACCRVGLCLLVVFWVGGLWYFVW